jgi:hypothetical protein
VPILSLFPDQGGGSLPPPSATGRDRPQRAILGALALEFATFIAVGEQAIFKAYLSDGRVKQARKIAALEFLAGRGFEAFRCGAAAAPAEAPPS